MELNLPQFTGFKPEAFKFLKAIKRNNKREWFQPRKTKYEEVLKTPMQSLIAELKKVCGKDLPRVVFDPKKAVFRIYRDVRFSEDKSPYKTHIGASFGPRKISKDEEHPGFYLQIEPGSVFIAGGLYMPSSNQLRKIRNYIDEKPQELLNVLEDPQFKKNFKTLQGSKLKTNPRGVDPEHPMIEYLRHKQFYVYKDYSDAKAMNKKFVYLLAKDLVIMNELCRWIESALAF